MADISQFLNGGKRYKTVSIKQFSVLNRNEVVTNGTQTVAAGQIAYAIVTSLSNEFGPRTLTFSFSGGNSPTLIVGQGITYSGVASPVIIGGDGEDLTITSTVPSVDLDVYGNIVLLEEYT